MDAALQVMPFILAVMVNPPAVVAIVPGLMDAAADGVCFAAFVAWLWQLWQATIKRKLRVMRKEFFIMFVFC